MINSIDEILASIKKGQMVIIMEMRIEKMRET